MRSSPLTLAYSPSCKISAAFDTIHHFILLHRLKPFIHITGNAFTWRTSYLSDRKQFICINSCSSSAVLLQQGVPQDSALGPVLFILYLLFCSQIIHHHGLHFQYYANDIQIYLSVKSIDHQAHSTLSNCISDVSSWMQSNFLKYNGTKSDIIGPKSFTSPTLNLRRSFDKSTPSSSPHSQNLSVIMDNYLTFSQQIKEVTKTTFDHLKNIMRLCYSLSLQLKPHIHSIIWSHTESCNSILYGTPSNLLNRLQISAVHLLPYTHVHITGSTRTFIGFRYPIASNSKFSFSPIKFGNTDLKKTTVINLLPQPYNILYSP